MKRLNQRYFDILNMLTEDRDEIFSLEMKVLEKEIKDQEEASNKLKN